MSMVISCSLIPMGLKNYPKNMNDTSESNYESDGDKVKFVKNVIVEGVRVQVIVLLKNERKGEIFVDDK